MKNKKHSSKLEDNKPIITLFKEYNKVEDEKIEFHLPPDIEGLITKISEVTGYTLETLMLQTMFSNHPDGFDDISPQDVTPYSFKEFAKISIPANVKGNVGSIESNNSKIIELGTKIPFWFHLESKFGIIFQKLKKKYENRISEEKLIELIFNFSIKRLSNDANLI